MLLAGNHADRHRDRFLNAWSATVMAAALLTL
jgi:hypothetical protein